MATAVCAAIELSETSNQQRMKSRQAVVQGRFYPSSRNRILNQISEIEKSGRYPEPAISPRQIFGAVLPHAGHMYSGYQTLPYFQLIQNLGIRPDTFVIVHPNHSGAGSPLAVDNSNLWVNSIGEVAVDTKFAKAMELPFDHVAHVSEHSAEVLIPFIQYYMEDHPFRIVPVAMWDQTYDTARVLAKRIKTAAGKTGRKIQLLASCDFSHFQSPEKGKVKDQYVLDEIMKRNSRGVESVVKHEKVSVCGYGPIMTLMEYAGRFDPEYQIRILARGHSGEVHPSPEVVHYISMILFR